MPEVKDGRLGRVIIDDRYSPLIVASFFGEIDLPLGQWYEETGQRVVRAQGRVGRRLVGIHDTSQAGRTSAEMRKFWGEMSKRVPPDLQRVVLSNLIVINSPIMRGVFTAVGWLNPDVAKLRTFPTLAAAIEAAVLDLKAEGLTVALPAGGYVLPELPARAFG